MREICTWTLKDFMGLVSMYLNILIFIAVFREGAHEVLSSLGTFNGIVDAVETGLLKIVPTLSDCTITK